MRSLRIASTLLMLICTTSLSESPAVDPSQRESLLRDWRTVRFGVYVNMSDYAARGNTIFLQRLDSERATLSVIREGSAAEWHLPVLVAIIPVAHATKLIEKVLDFFEIAKRDEPERTSSDRLSIFLNFVAGFKSGENHEYNWGTPLGAETHEKFRKFIEEAAKAPKI